MLIKMAGYGVKYFFKGQEVCVRFLKKSFNYSTVKTTDERLRSDGQDLQTASRESASSLSKYSSVGVRSPQNEAVLYYILKIEEGSI